MRDYLREHTRLAATSLRMALNSTGAYDRVGEPETVDLYLRLRNALALADPAYVEVGGIERQAERGSGGGA